MDLRLTDTNSADDAAGRVFGLDGNLYLPVVIAGTGGIAGFALLGFVFEVSFVAAGVVAALPFALSVAWAVLLRRGKPAGYDRDLWDQLTGGGDFGPIAAHQAEVFR